MAAPFESGAVEGLSELTRALIELACSRKISQYCYAADHHRLDEFLDVFAKDAIWGRPGSDPIRGHDEIRAFFLSRPISTLTRHVCSNVLVEVLTESAARATSINVVYRRENHSVEQVAPLSGPALVVEYADDFEKEIDGVWRIKWRRTSIVFASTAGRD